MDSSADNRLATFTILSSAAFAGGNLFIGLSMGGYWLSLEPTEFAKSFFGQWLFFLLTIMPLLLMTLYGLLRSSRSDAADPDLRALWRGAILCFGATCFITVVFHMPLNLRLGAATFSPEQAATSGLYGLLSIFGRVTPENAGFTRALWLIGHLPRIGLSIAIPILALRAANGRRDPSALSA